MSRPDPFAAPASVIRPEDVKRVEVSHDFAADLKGKGGNGYRRMRQLMAWAECLGLPPHGPSNFDNMHPDTCRWFATENPEDCDCDGHVVLAIPMPTLAALAAVLGAQAPAVRLDSRDLPACLLEHIP